MVRAEEIDVAVYRKGAGLSDRQQKQLIKITDTTWARTVMSRSKKSMNKLLNKIKSGIKQGKYKDALEVMKGIFDSVAVSDPDILEHYGFIQEANGNCEDAVLLWQAALKGDPEKQSLIKEIKACIGRN